MWDNAVITNVGKAALDAWIDGEVFRFDAATGGTGTVSPISLMAQTALVNQRQTLSIVGYENVPDGIRLHIQITAPDVGYTCNQIGVWGNVGGGGATLIALYQDDRGIQIPSASDTLDFVYSFFGTVATSNIGEYTVNVDAAALVSMSTLNSALNDKADAETLRAHLDNEENPHGVSKAQVGLGNVPDVATNDQKPTYTVAGVLESLASGELLSVAFGKIAKAVSSLIAHLSDKANPHALSCAQLGAATEEKVEELETALAGKQPKGNYADQDHAHDAATQTMPGFLSATDKAKLDGVENGANKYTHPADDGNLHVPPTGTGNDGKVLKAGSMAGSPRWDSLTPEEIGAATEAQGEKADTALQPGGVGTNLTVAFTQAITRANIATGETLTVMFGKLMKWFADLKTIAFTGSWTDLDDKPTSFTPLPHNHDIADVTSLESALDDKLSTETDPTVPAWAKQPTKPTYTASEVGARPDTWTPSASDVGARPDTWTPDITDVTGLDAALEGKQPVGNYLTAETDPTVPAWAKQPTKPTYTASEVGARPDTWTPSASDVGARPDTWTPGIADVTGLDAALEGKQPVGNYLTAETDPTVPAWAKQPSKPTYTASEVDARPSTWTPSATDVGAEPSGSVSTHNGNSAAHSAQFAAKADLTRQIHVTIPASAWIGDDAPYMAKVDVAGLAADPKGIVGLSSDATPEQREMMRNAILSPVSPGEAGKLTLIADGDRPEIDLPVVITLWG